MRRCWCRVSVFFVNDPATTERYTLSLHDALPIWMGFYRLADGFPEPLRQHCLLRLGEMGTHSEEDLT